MTLAVAIGRTGLPSLCELRKAHAEIPLGAVSRIGEERRDRVYCRSGYTRCACITSSKTCNSTQPARALERVTLVGKLGLYGSGHHT